MSKAMVLAYIDLRDGNGLRERCVMARPEDVWLPQSWGDDGRNHPKESP
jgi:hypothetical protein